MLLELLAFQLFTTITHGTLILHEDFSKLNLTWWGWSKDGETATIDISNAEGGRTGTQINFGITYCGPTCYRSEYSSSGHKNFLNFNEEYWFGFSTMLPKNWTYTDSNPALTYHFQLHGGDNNGRAPSFGLRTNGTKWQVNVYGEDRKSASDEPKYRYTQELGDLNPGSWEDWVVHLILDYNQPGMGLAQMWKDGSLLVNQKGLATAYNDYVAPYIKLGVYANTWTKEVPKDKWWGMKYWALKVGNKDSSFSEVSTIVK